jgi:hypothetical protein
MSALGQKQTSDWRPLMSALPPKADIGPSAFDVCFVPKADIAASRRRSVRRSYGSLQCTPEQAISAVQPGPAKIFRRKLCNLTIAATILKPSPRPLVFRVLSER